MKTSTFFKYHKKNMEQLQNVQTAPNATSNEFFIDVKLK